MSRSNIPKNINKNDIINRTTKRKFQYKPVVDGNLNAESKRVGSDIINNPSDINRSNIPSSHNDNFGWSIIPNNLNRRSDHILSRTECNDMVSCEPGPFITQIVYHVHTLEQGWGDQPYEAIEIYNPCNNRTVNLENWTLRNLKNCGTFDASSQCEGSCTGCEDQILFEFPAGATLGPGEFLWMARNKTTWLGNCGEGARWDYPGRCHDGTPCFPDKWYELGGRMDHSTYEVTENPIPLYPQTPWTPDPDDTWHLECHDIDGWGRITCQRSDGLGRSNDGSTYNSSGYLTGATDCLGLTDTSEEECGNIRMDCHEDVISSCEENTGIVPFFIWQRCPDCMGNYTDLEWLQEGCPDETQGSCEDGVCHYGPLEIGTCQEDSDCLGNCSQPGESWNQCCCDFSQCEIDYSNCMADSFNWQEYHGSEVVDICNQQAHSDNYCHPVSGVPETDGWADTCCIDGKYLYHQPYAPSYGKCCYCSDPNNCTPDEILSCETFLIGSYIQCIGDGDDPDNPFYAPCSAWDSDVCKGAPFSGWAGSGFPQTAADYWPNAGPAAWDFFTPSYCANDPVTGDPLGNPHSWSNCAEDKKRCGDTECPPIVTEYNTNTYAWNAAVHDPTATINTYEGSLYSTHYLSCGEWIRLVDGNENIVNDVDYTKCNLSNQPNEQRWPVGYGLNVLNPRLLAPDDPYHPEGVSSWDEYVNSDNRNWHVLDDDDYFVWLTPGFDSGNYQPYTTIECSGLEPELDCCDDPSICGASAVCNSDMEFVDYCFCEYPNCCDYPSICSPTQTCNDNCVCVDSSTCFTEGTKIKMADGTEKNIEDVVVGDKLMGKPKNTIEVPGTPWVIIYEKI